MPSQTDRPVGQLWSRQTDWPDSKWANPPTLVAGLISQAQLSSRLVPTEWIRSHKFRLCRPIGGRLRANENAQTRSPQVTGESQTGGRGRPARARGARARLNGPSAALSVRANRSNVLGACSGSQHWHARAWLGHQVGSRQSPGVATDNFTFRIHYNTRPTPHAGVARGRGRSRLLAPCSDFAPTLLRIVRTRHHGVFVEHFLQCLNRCAGKRGARRRFGRRAPNGCEFVEHRTPAMCGHQFRLLGRDALARHVGPGGDSASPSSIRPGSTATQLNQFDRAGSIGSMRCRDCIVPTNVIGLHKISLLEADRRRAWSGIGQSRSPLSNGERQPDGCARLAHARGTSSAAGACQH